MSLGSFVTLSEKYTAAAKAGADCKFLERRVTDEYNTLSVNDRLRLFSLLDAHDYKNVRPFDMKKATDAEMVTALETSIGETFARMRGKPLKTPFREWTPIAVALDLSDVSDPHSLAADPQAPYPV